VTPKVTPPPAAGGGKDGALFPRVLEGAGPPSHLDLRFPPSRTVREHISVVQATPFAVSWVILRKVTPWSELEAMKDMWTSLHGHWEAGVSGVTGSGGRELWAQQEASEGLQTVVPSSGGCGMQRADHPPTEVEFAGGLSHLWREQWTGGGKCEPGWLESSCQGDSVAFGFPG
jgi:hypothetical protein